MCWIYVGMHVCTCVFPCSYVYVNLCTCACVCSLMSVGLPWGCPGCGWCLRLSSVTRIQRDFYRHRHHVLTSAIMHCGPTPANILLQSSHWLVQCKNPEKPVAFPSLKILALKFGGQNSENMRHPSYVEMYKYLEIQLKGVAPSFLNNQSHKCFLGRTG